MARDIRLGNAVIGFRADVTKYIGNLARAEKAVRNKRKALRRLSFRMRQTQQRIQRFSQSLFSVRTAIGLITGGVLGNFVRQASNAGAELFEMSVRTGLTVRELQTLGRVMEGDGVQMERFVKTLVKLTQSIGGAQDGLESYAQAFELLGINVNNIRDTADLINQISDALASGTVDRSSAIYALQTLGGRQAALTFNTLARGSEVLKQQQDEFAKLGTLTTEQAARLKVLAQSQTDLSNVIKANTSRIVADLAGLFNQGLQVLIERVPAAFDRLNQVIIYLVNNLQNVGLVWAALGAIALKNSFVGRFITDIGKAGVALLNFRLVITNTRKTFNSLNKLTERFFPNFIKNATLTAQRTVRIVNSTAAAVVATAKSAGLAIAAVGKALGRLLWPLALVEGILVAIRYVKNFRSALENTEITLRTVLVVAFANFVEWLVENLVEAPRRFIAEFINGTPKIVQQVIAALRLMRRAIFSFAREVGGVIKDIFTGNFSVDQLKNRLQNFLDDIEVEARRLVAPEIIVDEPLIPFDISDAIIERFGVTQEEAEKALAVIAEANQKTVDDVRKQWATFTGDFDEVEFNIDTSDLNNQLEFIDDNFEYLKTQAEDAAETIENLNKRTADNMARAFGDAAKDIVIEFGNIEDTVKNLARTIVNELANRFIAAPITNALTGVFGGLFGGVGAAASGGRVGGLTLVGEAGPELVDFRRPAQVYSNDRLRQAIVGEAGTGVTVNQYFTVNSADSGAVERAMFDSLPSIVDAVKGAVNTDARRPSPTSAAFGTI